MIVYLIKWKKLEILKNNSKSEPYKSQKNLQEKKPEKLLRQALNRLAKNIEIC